MVAIVTSTPWGCLPRGEPEPGAALTIASYPKPDEASPGGLGPPATSPRPAPAPACPATRSSGSSRRLDAEPMDGGSMSGNWPDPNKCEKSK